MSRLLPAIQSQLEDIYEISVKDNVLDFVITDKHFAEMVTNSSIKSNVQEKVLVSTNDGYVDISLYFNIELIKRLSNQYPSKHTEKNDLHDFWIALEGVSHFLYLAWNASFDRPVSQLELELQAEVDKFVSASSAMATENDTGRMREIWSLLFSNPKFDCNLNQENLIRYQKANAYASQYCLNLIDMQNNSHQSRQNELRRFYRLGQQDKILHIDNLGTTTYP